MKLQTVKDATSANAVATNEEADGCRLRPAFARR
jgi:hypothetical protein